MSGHHGRLIHWAWIGGLLCFCLLTLKFLPDASAKPFRMALLPDRGGKYGCGTCHVRAEGGGARNAFGRDYQRIGIKAGEKYTKELGSLDSDGDGFSNDDEFAAGTHPGDPKSKPGN